MTQKNSNHFISIFICAICILIAIIFKLLPNYYFFKGERYLEQQDSIKAYNYLKKAYLLNKNNKNYKYYYVKALLNLPPTFAMQKEVFSIASSKENDSAQQIAQNQIYSWKNKIISTIGDNYIEQAPLNNQIIHWDTKKFPLKISIVNQSSTNVPDYYNTEIINAFNQWQASTGFIRFNYTNSSKDADILVTIAPLPKDSCTGQVCKYVVGFTTPEFKKDILSKMTITLYAKDPYGNFFSDKELYNTILHEIGHALGVMGHSYSSEDLMYMSTNNNNFYAPYRSSFQYLSSNDINTMKLLYMLAPEISNTPQDKINKKGLIYSPIILGTNEQVSLRKLQEAKNYIKNAPDISSGYIDLGIAYAELNKSSQAIKALKKAYELAKTDNDKYIATYNIAAVLLNNGNLNEALHYANIAKKILNTDDINELIMNINHSKNSKSKPFNEKVLSY